MNINAALASLALRIAAHPAVAHPLAGHVASLDVRSHFGEPENTAVIQLHCSGRSTLGALIAWAYQLDTPTVRVKKYTGAAHVNVEGTLDGDQVEVYTGFYGDLATQLSERIDLVDNEATISIHHLRAVQASTYRAAAAA